MRCWRCRVIRAKCPTSYGFIEEHDEYGLPDLTTARGILAGLGFAEAALPNGYLRHRLPLPARPGGCALS
jgi:hypothetical protein